MALMKNMDGLGLYRVKFNGRQGSFAEDEPVALAK